MNTLIYGTQHAFFKPMKTKKVWLWAGVVGGLIIGLIGASYYDAPPPDIKYTWRDLAVPEEAAASYETLMRYRKGGTNTLEIALPDDLLTLAGTWSNLLPHAEAIETAWNECVDGRQYIQDLDQFEYITDWNNPDEQPDMIEIPLPSFLVLRHLARLHVLHATLLTQQGKTTEAIQELAQHYSVTRKSLKYSTTLVTRMINIACAKLDIRTADHMIRNTDCTTEQLLAFKEAFPPLSPEQISWFRAMLGEYVGVQYGLDWVKRNGYKNEDFGFDTDILKKYSFLKPILYKPNQTLRYFKNFYEPMLEACVAKKDPTSQILASDQIAETFFSDSNLKNPWNAAGKLIIAISIPSLSKAHNNVASTQIKSELLAMEIHKRLGETLDLSDSYTGAAYRFDETHQRFYCIGPDGIDGTKDDIYINEPVSDRIPIDL